MKIREKFSPLFFALLGTGVLLFSFQNCGSLNHLEQMGSDSAMVSADAGSKGLQLLRKLQGEWIKTCTDLDPSDSRIQFMRDGSGQLEVKISRSDCEPLLSASVEFRYRIGEQAALEDGEEAFRLQARDLDRGVITPLNAKVAKAFQQAHYCGVSDWSVGEPRRVKFDFCKTNSGEILEQPFLAENLVQLSDKGLRLGQPGVTDDLGYPTRLEVFAFRKID